MKVFFTGSHAFGAGKGAQQLYSPMSRLFTDRLAGEQYGGGLDGWFVLFIFQDPDGPMGPAQERTPYRRAKRELDLRLIADHVAWRTADAGERHRLLYDTARRSFDIMRRKKIDNFDVDAFETDIEAIAFTEGWARE